MDKYGLVSWEDKCLLSVLRTVTRQGYQLQYRRVPQWSRGSQHTGGSPEPGKPQESVKTHQELVALSRAADEAWAGPGVRTATLHSHKRQP